jgi:hypothetical protein
MTALKAMEYLKSLIEGSKVSSIPIQTSELELLKLLMEMEQMK